MEEKRLLSEHSFAYITKIVYAKHNISLTQNTLKQRTKTKTIQAKNGVYIEIPFVYAYPLIQFNL